MCGDSQPHPRLHPNAPVQDLFLTKLLREKGELTDLNMHLREKVTMALQVQDLSSSGKKSEQKEANEQLRALVRFCDPPCFFALSLREKEVDVPVRCVV